MDPVQASISEDVAARADWERRLYGEAYLRVTKDGRIEHVPFETIRRVVKHGPERAA